MAVSRQLPRLERIDLSYNQMTELEWQSMSQLPSLRELNVSHNTMYVQPILVYGAGGFIASAVVRLAFWHHCWCSARREMCQLCLWYGVASD